MRLLAPILLLPAIALADDDALLSRAMDWYVNGKYREAIDVAREVTTSDDEVSRQKAWRIVGSSACYLRDLPTVTEACPHLMNRSFVVSVCARNDIEIDRKCVAKAAPPRTPERDRCRLARERAAYWRKQGDLEKARRFGERAAAACAVDGN